MFSSSLFAPGWVADPGADPMAFEDPVVSMVFATIVFGEVLLAALGAGMRWKSLPIALLAAIAFDFVQRLVAGGNPRLYLFGNVLVLFGMFVHLATALNFFLWGRRIALATSRSSSSGH